VDNGGLFSSRAELVGVLALAGFDAWTFSVFFTVIMWAISLYVLALALYPPRLSRNVDYREMFETNRTWFLSTLIIMLSLDIIVTGMRDQAMPGLFFLAYVGHYIAIAAIAIGVRKWLFDLVAAWYIAITMAFWSFGVRGTLF
jgi:hypothetical protein